MAPPTVGSFAADRRRQVRVPLGPVFRPNLFAFIESEPEMVLVRNISPGGISLVINRDLREGEEVTLRLIHGRRRCVVSIRAQVIFITRDLEGNTIAGARFTRELDETEVDAFLRPPAMCAEPA